MQCNFVKLICGIRLESVGMLGIAFREYGYLFHTLPYNFPSFSSSLSLFLSSLSPLSPKLGCIV